MTVTVYLAQPVDFSRPEIAERAHYISALLTGAGCNVYRPVDSWDIGGDVTPAIEIVNRAALGASDALFAYLPTGVVSHGVPREIEAAKHLGIPVIVLCEQPRFSLADCEVVSRVDVRVVREWVSRLAPRRQAEDSGRTNLLFAKIEGTDGKLPTRTYSGDAAFDLYVCGDYTIPPGEFRDVSCGVRVALPEGVWARITGRSSTVRKRNLLVTEGVIDTGWRGPLFAGVHNLSRYQDAKIKDGDRVAQLILAPNESANYRASWASSTEFAAIPHDGRGESGFGSSGS